MKQEKIPPRFGFAGPPADLHPAKAAPKCRVFNPRPWLKGDRARLLAAGLVVLLAVLITYRPAWDLGFVDYDDTVIAENSVLREGITTKSIHFAFTETPTNFWHPLTWLSHAADFAVFGDWIGGHHLTSLLIHLATALLLLGWLHRHTGKLGAPLAVSLLFAIHPLRVESVIWLSERKDVLAGFFYLLTVVFYSAWVTSKRERKWQLYLLSLIAAVLGALSKPSLMTLPAALFLVDLWPLQRLGWGEALQWRRWIPLLREKIPFLLLAIAVAWTSWQGIPFVGERPDFSLAARFSHAVITLTDYLARTVWPVDLIPYRNFPATLHPGTIALRFSILAALGVFALLRRKKSPWLLFGYLWFLGLILPGSGLITISDNFAPDRYTYLAHAGLFVALVWEATAFFSQKKLPPAVGIALLACLAIPLSVLTTRQSLHWKSPEALWTHTAAVDPDNYLANNQLGIRHLQSGQIEQGIEALKRALQTRPGAPTPLGNLSLAEARHGNPEAALHYFRQIGPELQERPRFRAELANAFTRRSRLDLAAALIRDAVAADPKNPQAQLEAGHAFYEIEHESEALRHYQRAAELAPDDPEISLTLGAMHLKLGETEKALSLLEAAAANASGELAPRASRTLAQAFLLKGRFGEAIDAYEQAFQSQPDSPELRNELAQLLLDCPDPALKDPLRALEVATPLEVSARETQNPRYLRTLARAHSLNQQRDAAAKLARKGLALIEAWEEIDPLPAPWTPEEFTALRTFFQGVLDEPTS